MNTQAGIAAAPNSTPQPIGAFSAQPEPHLRRDCQHLHSMHEVLQPAIEVMSALVCSTSHVTDEERSNFDEVLCSTHSLPVFMRGEYGWMFYIENIDEGDFQELSEGLRGAIRYAQRLGFSWLRLDRDAQALAEIVTYDW